MNDYCASYNNHKWDEWRERSFSSWWIRNHTFASIFIQGVVIIFDVFGTYGTHSRFSTISFNAVCAVVLILKWNYLLEEAWNVFQAVNSDEIRLQSTWLSIILNYLHNSILPKLRSGYLIGDHVKRFCLERINKETPSKIMRVWYRLTNSRFCTKLISFWMNEIGFSAKVSETNTVFTSIKEKFF